MSRDFQPSASEVVSIQQDREPLASARPTDWSAYLASDAIASEEFMRDVDDLPVQER
jgi:hypothetical protein